MGSGIAVAASGALIISAFPLCSIVEKAEYESLGCVKGSKTQGPLMNVLRRGRAEE